MRAHPTDGDRTLEPLGRQSHDQVWRVVWGILRHDQHTEQVVREVFLAARSAGSGSHEPPAPSWLLQTAASTALAFTSAEHPRARPLQRVGAAPQVLPGCFDTLGRSLRAPLALQREGLRYEEIARVLGLSAGTVRARLLLAREALDKCVRRKSVADV